jgi:UDP-N-acetylglucosamine--N-acetylmuramyl-(pentapeptide) pyrophosphoryl-undecaprenol N-acetylglucosamine transferase
MDTNRTYRIILSGGGTGGHIFPAIAVADRAMKLYPGSEVLFVGALGKMQSGYRIEGLPVAGLQRKLTLKNLTFPFKLMASLSRARKIIKNFKPDAVAGFGGYASGPVLWVASGKKIPSVIQEQNSFAGITNKLLARRVNRICVAYGGMEKYFPAEKIILTGNPVRDDIFNLGNRKEEAFRHFNLKENKKTILVIGGSLGARTINRSIYNALNRFIDNDIQVIWQAGKLYFDEYTEKIKGMDLANIRLRDFIREMDLAYSIADLVISRAGAISVSELSAAGKAVILVPSPNVAEDHQTKNANHLVSKSAAILVSDREAPEVLGEKAIELINDENKLKELSANISKLALRNSAEEIVNTLTGLLN